MRAEGRANAAKAGDDLIGDQQHIVFAQNSLYGGPITLGRWRDATRAEHGLSDEGTHRLGALTQDQCLELLGAALGELGFALAFMRFPVVMRRARMDDAGYRQIHVVMIEAHARERARDHAAAVIAAMARDDLLLLGLAAQVVVIPDELHLRFVGVRSGQAIEDLAHLSRCHTHQPV